MSTTCAAARRVHDLLEDRIGFSSTRCIRKRAPRTGVAAHSDGGASAPGKLKRSGIGRITHSLRRPCGCEAPAPRSEVPPPCDDGQSMSGSHDRRRIASKRPVGSARRVDFRLRRLMLLFFVVQGGDYVCTANSTFLCARVLHARSGSALDIEVVMRFTVRILFLAQQQRV